MEKPQVECTLLSLFTTKHNPSYKGEVFGSRGSKALLSLWKVDPGPRRQRQLAGVCVCACV